MEELRLNQTVDLTPEEAQEYTKQGYTLIWQDKQEHHKGEPKVRSYLVTGRNQKKC